MLIWYNDYNGWRCHYCLDIHDKKELVRIGGCYVCPECEKELNKINKVTWNYICNKCGNQFNTPIKIINGFRVCPMCKAKDIKPNGLDIIKKRI